MSHIVSLIRKDVLLSANYLLFIAAYLVFLSYTTMQNDLFSVSLFVTMPSILLLVNSCMQDVRNMNQRFALSLPVRRSQIVTAKYISIVPYLLFGIGCTVLSSLILNRLGHPLAIHWRDFGFTVLLVPASAAVYLPIYYWLGPKGQQIVNTAFFMIMFFGSMNLNELIKAQPWLGDFISNISRLSLREGVVAGLLYIAFILVSYIISLRILSTRDL
ncbi:ABC-2 type transport system permease protein [Paenibacillus forsythiae]|uniref:ABC-2 type transport system permease protein n=1 Tax=Paenibacillus forsythiae TaxID=365616 RepID=A0ABU3H1Y1_9BACL|nr:ABC-2 transporter permease [Paenibacillus forsythiae]MDT3424822.1 ABC-2 type transport system permease protein [Paenibacillus forsythiae]